VVYHVGGGSLPQGNPRKTYLNFRNNLMMMFKNLPSSSLVPKILFRILLDIIAAFYGIMKARNFKDAGAIFKAHFSFYASLPQLLFKRKNIPHASSLHLTDVSVIWQYFIKGKKKYSEIVSH
jgi:hypothetical protein